MAVTHMPIFPQTPKVAVLEIENSDGVTLQSLITAGTDGAKISSIAAVSDDTTDVTLQIYFNDGSTDGQVGEIVVPDGSGTNGTDKAVSILNATDFPWLPADLAPILGDSDIVKVAAKATVTSAKKVTVTAFWGDY